MNWIGNLKDAGHIAEALSHYNKAESKISLNDSAVEISNIFSNALNKIQTEWMITFNYQIIGEVKNFQTMIIESLDDKAKDLLLKSQELKDLVYLEPKIMSHKTLRENDYRPNIDINPELIEIASNVHKNLKNKYEKYHSENSKISKDSIIGIISRLLYIVRSNIAHGEKTPYGPDLNKIKRDEIVCKTIFPLQKLLLNLLFDYPDQKFVVYGTLAPGEINHSIILDIQGHWEDCKIIGELDKSKSIPYFNWNPKGQLIDAKLFSTAELPDCWKRIDRFEGEQYRRLLIPVLRERGIAIANCYVENLNRRN